MKIFLTYFLKYQAAFLYFFQYYKETQECVKRTQALVISFLSLSVCFEKRTAVYEVATSNCSL